MKKIVRSNERVEEKVSKVHLCKTLLESLLKDTKVEYLDLGPCSGWYFVDLSIKVEGSGGANYGTAILYCPYCGEKL